MGEQYGAPRVKSTYRDQSPPEGGGVRLPPQKKMEKRGSREAARSGWSRLPRSIVPWATCVIVGDSSSYRSDLGRRAEGRRRQMGGLDRAAGPIGRLAREERGRTG